MKSGRKRQEDEGGEREERWRRWRRGKEQKCFVATTFTVSRLCVGGGGCWAGGLVQSLSGIVIGGCARGGAGDVREHIYNTLQKRDRKTG